MTTVRVQGATQAFGRTRALDGVDHDAGPGVTGLLGPNGAGKTTLLRMIATVLAPDRGTVTLLKSSHEVEVRVVRIATPPPLRWYNVYVKSV